MPMRRALTVLMLLLVWASCKRVDPVVGKRTAAETAEVAASPSPAAPADAEAVARDREAQRQTTADVRRVGTAMFSWLTDQIGAAAAGSSQIERPGTHADMGKYVPISRAELEKILVPQYAQSIPENDGWGHPYEYYLNVKNTLAQQVLGVRSPGRDGIYSDTDYSVQGFDWDDFDQDIVWVDGFFVRWPAKKSGEL